MSVQPGPTEKRYAANGVTTIYAVPFLVIEAGDLKVYLNGVLQTSGYTQTGVGLPTSSVTFTIAPSGDLYFVLEVPFQRLVDYQENGDFLSSTVNRDFDRIWQALKQLLRASARALTLGYLDVDGSGFYRAKGNGIVDLASANGEDSAAPNWKDVKNLVQQVLETGQGPINNAANIVFVDTEGNIRTVQDLSNSLDPALGGAMIGLTLYANSEKSNVGRILKRNNRPSVFDYMTEIEIADVLTLSPVLDHTAAIQKALDNHLTVSVPPYAFNVTTLQLNKFGHSLIGIDNTGAQIYGGGTVLKSSDGALDIVTISKPTCYLKSIAFFGKSNDIEKGEDVAQAGVRAIGSDQKDLDAKIHDCSFIYVRSGIVANGTNVEIVNPAFSNLKFGFETVTTGGWENRGFVFAGAARFHSIGKTGVFSAGIMLWPAHNIRDVQVGSCLADDTTTLISGFASGLQVAPVQSVRARGTGISIDSTGHSQPSQFRDVNIAGLQYYATDTINQTTSNSAFKATGLMRLVVDGVISHGSGGHGIDCAVDGAIITNSHSSDAGQSSTNTYDGVIVSGVGAFLKSVSSSQDAQGSSPANKSRYGINLLSSTYVSGILPGTGPLSGPLNVAATAQIFGDLPRTNAPANSITWGIAMPTSGTRRQGDFHWNTNKLVAGTAGSQYVVIGWGRLTTGSGHVLGTDWVALRALTGT
ncbi:hypothetical protein [Pseudomonas sp. NFACC05-1]|uniref:hypothetical protein n=1 Tax=Pseudomonas sp. NFACC05-1 TaxID=1566241 RepID=UPI0008718241|nr:hypothetical protein [Pseudomonas sp. NFACC05-1]SCW91719.1 hypothetical protein SAMN03159424_04357 [Pseudomonas sp. NFACC05-1]